MAAASFAITSLVILILQLVLGLDQFYSLNETAGGSPNIPAVIVFGDSIVDPGNNNVILTLARSNFPPYGQDFIGHRPTGRFSNGKIPSDFLASGLGVKEFVPPYLGVELSPEDILTGVSFASGASGFDPLTPKLMNAISMTGQLELFGEYKKKLISIAGEKAAADIISRSIYIVCSGTDDIANTYFPTPFRKLHYDVPSYVNLLVTLVTQFIEQLLAMGANKIGFVGLPPIGCLPSQRTVAGGIFRECDPKRNQAALLYNSQIQNLTEKLTRELGGGRDREVIYLDIYNILTDIIQRPSEYGFEETTRGCCGTGEIEAAILCNPKTPVTCDDPNKYVFWDSYHPTQRTYKIVVDSIFKNYIQYLQ